MWFSLITRLTKLARIQTHFFCIYTKALADAYSFTNSKTQIGTHWLMYTAISFVFINGLYLERLNEPRQILTRRTYKFNPCLEKKPIKFNCWSSSKFASFSLPFYHPLGQEKFTGAQNMFYQLKLLNIKIFLQQFQV